jgi:hypothetical protein
MYLEKPACQVSSKSVDTCQECIRLKKTAI